MGQVELRAGARRLSKQRLRIRAVVGAGLGAFLEQAVTVIADWGTGPTVTTLAALAAGAIAGVAGPSPRTGPAPA